jgi:hypothetical protein
MIKNFYDCQNWKNDMLSMFLWQSRMNYSLSRTLESHHLKKFVNALVSPENMTVVDLGGEINSYYYFLKSSFKNVRRVNLESKKPHAVVDFTKPFHEYLLTVKPDVIISINTVEHLETDAQFFDSIGNYIALSPGTHLFLACPFMHKLHAAPFDFRRYTYFGLQKKINNLIKIYGNSIIYKIEPVGGSPFKLILSILYQINNTLGLLSHIPLAAADRLYSALKILKQRVKQSHFPEEIKDSAFAMGYIVRLSNLSQKCKKN